MKELFKRVWFGLNRTSRECSFNTVSFFSNRILTSIFKFYSQIPFPLIHLHNTSIFPRKWYFVDSLRVKIPAHTVNCLIQNSIFNLDTSVILVRFIDHDVQTILKVPLIYRSDFRAIFVACQFAPHVAVLSSFPSKSPKISRPLNPNPTKESLNFTWLQLIGRKIMDVEHLKVSKTWLIKQSKDTGRQEDNNGKFGGKFDS